MRHKFNPALCLVTKPMATFKLIQTIKQTVGAGVTWVQLRDYMLTTDEMIMMANDIKAILPPDIPLIVNNDVMAAKHSLADGLHVGQRNMSPEKARSIIGDDMILGFTLENTAQLIDAHSRELDIDYYGVGPVFPTRSKPDAPPPMGLPDLAYICDHADKPVVAIGGITAANVSDIMQSGCAGAAVIGAICNNYTPYHAAKELSDLINQSQTRCNQPF